MLLPGQPVPVPLARAPVVVVDDLVLEAPGDVVERLHSAWARRERVVVRLAVDPARLRVPEACETPPHELGPRFEFRRERLHFLVWANNYDLTRGAPAWRLAEHAIARLGARPGRTADILLPDGREAWCDGGPRGPLDLPIIHGESIALGRLRPAGPGTTGEGGPDLAEDQLRAVRHGAGPARVIAPAGSGKTRVLAARLHHLLHDRGYDPECVTALAYNKRAASELQERTGGLGARVRTLHALGYEIVRRHRSATVLQEHEVRSVIAGLVNITPQRGRDPLAAWIEALAEVRLGFRSPDRVERERGDVPGFASFLPRYRDRLRSKGVIDHDEQIYGALEILLASPEERRAMQRQCRHLLVDEFQDLTPAYLLMVRLLAAPGYQVFGVGDDDQVIYGYLGACPDYLVRYGTYFPHAAEYALEHNYRCPPLVVGAATRLLERNRVRVAKNVRPHPHRRPTPDGLHVARVPAESMTELAVKAVQQVIDEGHPPESVAVLGRVNSTLLPMQVALAEAGIPHTTPVDAGLLERSGVRAALAWLTLALTPEPFPADGLLETLQRPSRKIRRVTLDALGQRVAWTERALLTWAASLVAWERDAFRAYLEDLRTLRRLAATGTTARLLQGARVEIGLEREASTLDQSRSDARGQSHVDDLLALEQLAHLHPDPADFVPWIRERLAARGSRGVQLSTIHRVKGLEWDHVIVFGASWGLMPHHMAETPEALEEERRVFHVALTRGRKRVLVLADQEYPSRYLAEMEEKPQAAGGARKAPAAVGPTRAPRTGSAAGERIVAEVGLVLESPHAGTVCEIGADHVQVRVASGSLVRVRYGERVRSQGRQAPLGRAPRVAGPSPPPPGKIG